MKELTIEEAVELKQWLENKLVEVVEREVIDQLKDTNLFLQKVTLNYDPLWVGSPRQGDLTSWAMVEVGLIHKSGIKV